MPLLTGAPGLFAVSAPIAIEGLYGDWEGISPVWIDPAGDNGSSLIDFGRLWIANDGEKLFLRFEVGTEIKLNADNSVTLYIDWDGDCETGSGIAGIGADFKWEFGSRTGTAHTTSGEYTFLPAAIGLRRAPTVSSDQFEIAISRIADLPVSPGNTIPLLFRNEAEGIQDTLPDSGAVSYTFSTAPVPPYEEIPLEKKTASDLRILTYNVLADGLFKRTGYFTRILKALRPDILNFQEIYNHTATETCDLIEQILPSAPGETWYSARNADCITISRSPIIDQWAIDGNLAYLIDLPPTSLIAYILIINAHLPCCDDDAGRQYEADHIMAFIRDALTPGGDVTLPENTPIMVVGDLNLVGWAQQLKTLLTGDIIDEEKFGPDHPPDWDGSPLADCISYHTATRDAYTWRSDISSFSPGRLDYVIYTDSVMRVVRHFILWTPTMAPEDLAKYGLEADDTSAASDHLPHTADFRFPLPGNFWMLR